MLTASKHQTGDRVWLCVCELPSSAIFSDDGQVLHQLQRIFAGFRAACRGMLASDASVDFGDTVAFVAIERGRFCSSCHSVGMIVESF